MNTRRQKVQKIVSSKEIGASFSLISCQEYGISWQDALQATLDIGIRRFRMMSYWNLIEADEGTYDFSALDEQLNIVSGAGGSVTLTIGIKQPRWPETHMPEWAKSLRKEEAAKKYLDFHKAVIERYKDSTVVESWQLENEFWLRSFGEHFDFSRQRLKKEFRIIREIDPQRPIIMSVSSFLSLPLFAPRPDIYATSIYRNIFNSSKQKYTHTWISPWMYRVKRWLIRLIHRRDFVVHELQAEPWGPKANWEMDTEEQFKSMNPGEVRKAVEYSLATGMTYADLWGAEWWYWRKVKDGDDSLEDTVKQIVETYSTL